MTIHEPGAVAFAKIGIALTYNRRRQIVRPTLLDNNMMSAQPHPNKLSSSFLYYLLQTIDFNEVSAGSALPYLTIGSLNKIALSVPCIEEQQAIAEALGSLDDKIELNRRMNVTLEAMAQAIFCDWFVDFGPTRRKIEGATDPVEIMGGLVSEPERALELAELFPAQLGDNGLPEGWEAGFASALIDFNPSEPLKKGTVAPYSDMGSLPTKGSLADRPVERAFGSGMRFRNGDALLARITPCLENGKAAYVDFLPDDVVGWGSTEFIVLRARLPLPSSFAYLLVRHAEFLDRAITSMTGTSGRQRAQVEILRNFMLPRASVDVFKAFGHSVEPLFDLISANGRLNHTLAATRDLLLPKLMSGEIRLREVERQIEEVA